MSWLAENEAKRGVPYGVECTTIAEMMRRMGYTVSPDDNTEPSTDSATTGRETVTIDRAVLERAAQWLGKASADGVAVGTVLPKGLSATLKAVQAALDADK